MVRSALTAVLLAALAFASGGCAAIGWAVAAFAPPERVRAEYKPPRDKAYLVLVDDVMTPAGFETVQSDLASQLNDRLEQEGIAFRTVDQADVMRLASTTGDFSRLSVSEIGERLGADVVVYVHVNKFDVSRYAGSTTWNGEIESTVRVVDVHEARRLWPDDRPAGFPAEKVLIENVDMEDREPATVLSKMIAERSADNIMKLFVDHRKQR